MTDISNCVRGSATMWRCVLGASALSLSVIAMAVPAASQTRSPEIEAKERRDPASGEVIILNKRKAKTEAPDPYAPIKLKPLTSETAKQAETTRRNAASDKKARVESERATTEVGTATRRNERNPAARTSEVLKSEPDSAHTARLKQFPQAPLGAVPPPPSQRANTLPSDRTASAERRRTEAAPVRRPQRRIARGYNDRKVRRTERAGRRANGVRRDDWRHSDRQAFRQRPWRLCRRWAWRCEDGFEGACIRWQRNCS